MTRKSTQHTSSQVAASWRERALTAEDQLRKTNREIHTLRDRVGELMGQLDDLTTARVENDIQTVNSANTELKQRIRQLNANCRQLEDKLAPALTNNRFLDKRVAALEAELLERVPAATPRR